MHKKSLELLKLKCPRIEKTRTIGTIAAFDIKNANYAMPSLKQKFLQQGILLMPLGNTVYLLPPYCISNQELELAYNKIENVIHSL